MEVGGHLFKAFILLGGYQVIFQCQKETSEYRHFQTNLNTFQLEKPVLGNQECRNLHDFERNMGIRQAFRSSFFTNYDIMSYVHTSQADLGMLSLLLSLSLLSRWLRVLGNLSFPTIPVPRISSQVDSEGAVTVSSLLFLS
jgi:hypothetical protein